MINKISYNSHPSFKSVFIGRDFFSDMTPQNKAKFEDVFDSLTYLFPQNNVFVDKDKKGNMNYKIFKANPMQILVHPEVSKLFKTYREAAMQANIAMAFENLHQILYNPKRPQKVDKITDFETKSEEKIYQQLFDDILDFNLEYPRDDEA